MLLVGLPFAGGCRTVTGRLRAVGVRADFAEYFYFLASLARKTKRVAVQLVQWLALIVRTAGKTRRIVIDGGCTKAPFLRRVLTFGVMVVSRLRKDAEFCDLP